MPLYPPRSEPIKKIEQLSQRELELRSAIRKKFTPEKLNIVAEKYREAQLLFLKAKLHVAREKEIQNKVLGQKIEKLESVIEIWKSKPVEVIIQALSSSK